MKKLFNYALLAAALLVGVNVNAEEKQILLANLQAELNAANDGDILKISDGPTTLKLDDEVNFYSGKKVTLDLNNHDIEFTKKVPFNLYRGALTITGTGKIFNKTVGGRVIRIMGCYEPQLDGEGNPIKYSHLIVDKDVVLDGESRAIEVYTHGGFTIPGTEPAEKLPATTLTTSGYGIAENVFVDIYGKVTGGEYGVQTSGNLQEPKTTLTFVRDSKNVNPINEGNLATYIACVPQMHLYPGSVAYVSNEPYNDNGTTHYGEGVYSGGYANWIIEGTCYGPTGVYIKMGTVTVKDANIYSTWTQDVVATTATGSGTISAGNGIVVESNGIYSGTTTVTVEGNSTVTGGAGYGIEQKITTGSQGQLDVINIEGGDVSGDQGSIIINTEDKNDLVVSGGTTDGKVNIEGDKDHPKDIKDYTPEGTHATIVTNEDGHSVVVITQGAGTTEAKITQSDFNSLAAGANVNFSAESEAINVNADKTLGEVTMAHANNLTVNAGATLTAKNIIMDANANITVEPGATLIITGKDGFKNQGANNLVLKADQTNQAQFLLSPDAKTNTHPKATVEYASAAYRDGSTVADFFGAPMNVVDTVYWTGAAAYSVYFYVNDKGSDWTEIGNIIKGNYQVDAALFNRPFGFFEIAANNPSSALQTYTFKGNIYGNTCPEVDFKNGWPGFSNAYMAKVKPDAFWNYLATQISTPAIYTWRVTGPTSLAWDPYNPIVAGTDVIPLKAFMLRNTEADKKLTMDYEAMVWNPAMGISNNPPSAPRLNHIEKATMRVVDANGVYDKLTVAQDESFDANCIYNAEKFMNSELNLYVKAEKNLAIAAMENLDNTYVGFNCKNAGKYAISFENVTGNFALVDNKTNARIQMTEGATYEFLAEAGEDAYRFMIVEGAKAPTEMQKTNAAVKANKALVNGQIVISNGERFFNVLGADVK